MGGALHYRAQLQTGETVLVLGAGGSAGQLAVHWVRILGACGVVGAPPAARPSKETRSPRGRTVRSTSHMTRPSTLAWPPRRPAGYDVIVDFLWGGLVPDAMNLAPPARAIPRAAIQVFGRAELLESLMVAAAAGCSMPLECA